jgi:DNA mismatch repair protein MutS
VRVYFCFIGRRYAFGEDAVHASKMRISLKRGAGSETETALAGFPHHSLNTYLPKLVKTGLRWHL